MTQNYKNHIRYYWPHHFVFLPLVTLLTVIGAIRTFTDKANQLEWALFALLSGCILYLTLMVRQHYALKNQDRIVRLEFRLRHFELTGTGSKEVERLLSFSQLAALRFAPDEEFHTLLNLALKENLSGDDIKRSIKNWQADNMRV